MAQAAFITSKHRPEYSRLNFNWESQVEYDLKQKGNLVTLKFKKSHPLTKAQIDSQLKSDLIVVHSITSGKDSLEIEFELKKPASALSLNKGGLVVLDFIFDDPPAEQKKQDGKPDPKAKEDPKASNKDEAKEKPDTKAKEDPKAPSKDEAKEKPDTKAKEDPKTPSKDEVKEKTDPKAKEEPKAPSKDEVKEKPDPKAKEDPAPAKKEVEVVHPAEAKEVPKVETADPKKEYTAGSEDLQAVDSTVHIKIEETVEGLKLVFDFSQASKAGAFIEAGDLWLYFDQAVRFSWDEATLSVSQFVRDLTTYKSNNLSAVKIDLATEPDKASFYKKGYQWILETTDMQGITPAYVKPSATDRVVTFSNPDFGDPILAEMPGTGIPRYFIPSEAGSVRLEKKFRYIDFCMLPTLLGVIVDPLSQGVSVTKQDHNVVIAKDTGLALSAPVDWSKPRNRYLPPSLLNFKEWASDAEDTAKNKRDFQWEIIRTPKQGRTPKRLELVRHYLLTNRYYEALGLLASSLMYDPSLDKSPYFHSLKGLAAFAARRYDDARKSFENPVLAGDPEMRMWSELSLCRDHPAEANFENLAGGTSYLETYPSFLKNSALLLAADAAITQKQDDAAFLEQLHHDELTPRQQEHLAYLKAYNLSMSANSADALPLLENYSENMKSDFGLTANLLLIKLKSEAQSITPKDEIEALEKLRYRWSGDKNEYDIWIRLSDRYHDLKDYERSLKFLRKAIRHFPKLAMRDNLQQRGEKFFLQALNDQESDLFMLIGLFQEYDIFIPLNQRRFKIQEQLIDLLVKADLVDQAMDLLDQTIKDSSLNDEQKIRVRTRYGLLALLNDQPEKALKIINYQDGENLPGDLGDQRKYLVAQTYLMQGKYESVRNLLKDDQNPAAFELVAQSYLDQKDWETLAPYIQTYLDEQLKDGSKIDPETVLRLATAYGLLRKDDQLKKLRDDHLKLMSDSPYKEAFELITAENPTDFSSLGLNQELSKSKQLTKFLDTYREKVKQQGLSVL
jgi:hypothetical protein